MKIRKIDCCVGALLICIVLMIANIFVSYQYGESNIHIDPNYHCVLKFSIEDNIDHVKGQMPELIYKFP